jgi:hypothetical protein
MKTDLDIHKIMSDTKLKHKPPPKIDHIKEKIIQAQKLKEIQKFKRLFTSNDNLQSITHSITYRRGKY